MTYSPAGIELTKAFEGCRLTAYQDSVGVWTIGYGHTAGVKEGDHWTQEQAETWLEIDIHHYADMVSDLVKVALDDCQWFALVDFVFNLGYGALARSTLLKKLNAGDYSGAADEFLRWNKAGGKVLEGLTRRREAEKAMFEGRDWRCQINGSREQ